jgi:predicted peptidase
MSRPLTRLAVAALILLVAVVARSVFAHERAPSAVPDIAYNRSDPPKRGEFNLRWLRENGESYPYQLFLPKDSTPGKRWPVIVALHGSGQKGSDGVKHIVDGLATYVRERSPSFPAIVIFPQAPNRERGNLWSPLVLKMLDSVVKEFDGDPSRVYLTGVSFGGGLAYDLAYHNPDRFAALVPVASPLAIGFATGNKNSPRDSVYQAFAQTLHRIPMWIFHGASDTNAPTENTRALVQIFQAAGTPLHYTEYPGQSHVIWDRAYHTPELYTWLFAQHR